MIKFKMYVIEIVILISYLLYKFVYCRVLNVLSFTVLPKVSPSDGVTNKPISMGDPVTFSFTVVNEPVPPVTSEGIKWVFMGSGGTVNLSCTSTPKYTFSNDCLNLTLNNTNSSDAGLYQIVLPTEAGAGMGTVVLIVSGGEL